MPVTFRNTRLNNLAASLSVEETYRLFGSWAGIHDFQFDSRFALDTKTVTGVGSGNWEIGETVAVLPPSFEFTYHKTAQRQAVFLYDVPGGVFFLIGTDADGNPFINSAVTFELLTIPKDTPVEADVKIVFQQQRYDDSQDAVWRSITVYMNDAWVTSFSQLFPLTAASVELHFATFDEDVTTYTDIRVPELCEIAEFGTLDPGESAMSGLQRTTDGRYLKSFLRFDGSFRAWKKKQREEVMVIDTEINNVKRSYEMAELITHARMIGAYIWAEAVDIQGIIDHGQRFFEVNNQMLLTENECAEEAGNTLKRSKEDSFGIAAATRHVAILEPEDRIGLDGNSWILNDYDVEGGYGTLRQSMNARTYVWGE